MDFDIIPSEAIANGRATDAYYQQTELALEADSQNPTVVAEVTADQFPTGEFELLAGIKDSVALLEGVPVDVDSMSEGQLFDGGPVMRITGPYQSFARYETALLGFLSHTSGMATAALRCRTTAPETQILSFGTRHIHPSMAGIAERAALIGGVDGFSHVAAGKLLDREPAGTIPHALMICFGRGNQEAAWRAFDAGAPDDMPRIALCDTYSDEVDETLRAVATLGDQLDGVRLDTTGSRRGDFEAIVREVQWELKTRGHEDVDVFVSGGLEPTDLQQLRHVVDGFGVGGAIVNADPVDFALDIVTVEGDPAAKRGKLSGVKQSYRTPDGGHHVGLADREPPADAEPLLEPLLRDGDLVRETSFNIDTAATRAIEDADHVEFP